MGGLRPARVRRAFLALATIVLIVGPVTGLAWLAQSSIARDLEARSARDRVRTAELASRLVAHYLEDAGWDIEYLTGVEEIQRAFAAGYRGTIGSQLAAATRSWPVFRSMLALDARGIEIAVASRGSVVPADTVGQDRSRRDYFVGALTSRETYVTQAYRSGAPGAPVLVAVSKAVRDGPMPLGVVVGAIAPEDLLAEITEALDGSAGVRGRYLVIVDNAGNVISSTDPGRPPLSPAGLPGVVSALEGAHTTTTVRLDGDERVVTAVPIDGSRWVLYVVDDPDVVLAVERGLNRTVGWAAVVMIVAALAAATVVILLYAVLARRHRQLEDSRQELADANAELALASQHKTEFLSSVSHELRTPLNAILGFTDLLDEQLRDGLTDRQRRYFRNVRSAGEHLLSLIDDVLDLSRVESGRIELHPEESTLEHLLEPVYANVRRSAGDKGIAFESTAAEGPVRVDVGRVRQVLYNLGSNAVKFTPPGGRIRCDARLEADALVVDVTDTGIGIPADRQDRAFGMFQRLNEDRSDAKGTGIGLALSKMLVELHGGAIWFESVADVGTTFHVRIPGVAVRARPESPREVADARAAG